MLPLHGYTTLQTTASSIAATTNAKFPLSPLRTYTTCPAAGREAYLRTKQMLDEASAVSNTLFLDEVDMSRRYQRAYEREGALDAAAAAAAAGGSGVGGMPGANSSSGSGFFNEGSLFFAPAGGDGRGSSSGGDGGVLAAVAAGRSAPAAAAVEIRPEEKQFCEAFLELQALLVSVAVAAAAAATFGVGDALDVQGRMLA